MTSGGGKELKRKANVELIDEDSSTPRKKKAPSSTKEIEDTPLLSENEKV